MMVGMVWLACQGGGLEPVCGCMRDFSMSGRAKATVVFAVGFCGFCVLLLAWKAGIGVEELRRAWELAEDFLRERPLWLFLALVILPGLPVPTSALLFLAGVVWREQPLQACLIAILALTINLAWTYGLAAGFGRRTLDRLAAWCGFQIPELKETNQLRVVLALKLTPGIPMFVQNYLCGFLRVPFRLYLLVSLPSNGLIGTGFVLAGVGLGDGKLVPALAGLFLVILGALVIRWVRAFA